MIAVTWALTPTGRVMCHKGQDCVAPKEHRADASSQYPRWVCTQSGAPTPPPPRPRAADLGQVGQALELSSRPPLSLLPAQNPNCLWCASWEPDFLNWGESPKDSNPLPTPHMLWMGVAAAYVRPGLSPQRQPCPWCGHSQRAPFGPALRNLRPSLAPRRAPTCPRRQLAPAGEGTWRPAASCEPAAAEQTPEG